MKHLNSKERRKAFWRYTGLFILAVLPICITIYLFGRVSHAENAFLRDQYNALKSNQIAKEGEVRMYTSLMDESAKVNSDLNQYTVNSISGNQSGVISNSINKFENSLAPLRRNGITASEAEKSLLQISDNLIMALRNLNNNYYGNTFKKLDELRGDLKKCEEKLDDTEKELRKCESRIY